MFVDVHMYLSLLLLLLLDLLLSLSLPLLPLPLLGDPSLDRFLGDLGLLVLFLLDLGGVLLLERDLLGDLHCLGITVSVINRGVAIDQ